MVSDGKHAVRLGEIRSKFDGALGGANGVTRPFDSHIEACHFEQTLRIRSKLCLDLLSGPKRSVSLTAQIQVRRNLRDDAGKQVVRYRDGGFVDRTQELI